MAFFDDLGDGANNLIMGLGDGISGKNQAEVAKQQLANQQAAIEALKQINTQSTGTSNTPLIIGIVVGVVVLLGVIAIFAFKKS
jgi:hypothetical protein